MQLKTFTTLALAAITFAQSTPSLTDALASQNATLSTLTGLLGGFPALVEALSQATNITILAPNNDALAAFIASPAGAAAAADSSAVQALLTYHVLNGSFPASAFTSTPAFAHTLLSNASFTNVTGGQVVAAQLSGSDVTITSGLLSKSKVVTADLAFTGGVIHIIDSVLTIPQSPSFTATAANLTSLAGALTSANLVSTVDGLKDVTIFAPTNDAFGAIASSLTNASTEALTSILTYHVVQGTVGYSSLLTNTTLKTVNGKDVTISIADGSVFVNSAKVVIADVLVSNGVVHVIDSVLNPDSTSATPTPSPTSGTSPGASSNAPNPTSTPPTVSSAGAARALETGAMGLGALFGAAAMFMA